MNPVAMTITNPRKEYWPSRRSNLPPPVLKSATLLTELLWSAQRERDRERDRERERERERRTDRPRQRQRERKRETETERDRQRERERKRERERERELIINKTCDVGCYYYVVCTCPIDTIMFCSVPFLLCITNHPSVCY